MASEQRALILRIDLQAEKEMHRGATAEEGRLNELLAAGWRVVATSPFSGAEVYRVAALVIVEKP